MQKESAVVVFSSGQDSTTILIKLLSGEVFDEIHAITFDYGQRHIQEVENSRKVIKLLSEQYPEKTLTQKVINIESMMEIVPTNYLMHELKEIKTTEKGLPSSFVPGRNILFFTLASMYAYAQGSKEVYVGISEEDYSGYPDCTNEFVQAMEKAVKIGMEYEVKIQAPFMYLDKAEIHHEAYVLGQLEFVDEHTITCYEGQKSPGCQKCPACILRQNGLDRFKEEIEEKRKLRLHFQNGSVN